MCASSSERPAWSLRRSGSATCYGGGRGAARCSCWSTPRTWRSRGPTTSAMPISFFCRRIMWSRCAQAPELRQCLQCFRACRIARSPLPQLRRFCSTRHGAATTRFQPSIEAGIAGPSNSSTNSRRLRHRIQRIRQVWQTPPYTALTRTGKSRTHSSTSCAIAGRQFRGSRRMNLSGWNMETSANASKNCSTPICKSAAKSSRLRACTSGFENSDTTEALAMSDFSSRLEVLATCFRIASGRLHRERPMSLVFCDPIVSTPSTRSRYARPGHR